MPRKNRLYFSNKSDNDKGDERCPVPWTFVYISIFHWLWLFNYTFLEKLAKDQKSFQVANRCLKWQGPMLLNRILYLGNDWWASIFFIAPRFRERKIQCHTTKSDKKPSHQTPESTLKKEMLNYCMLLHLQMQEYSESLSLESNK